jgi:hypothetical protein
MLKHRKIVELKQARKQRKDNGYEYIEIIIQLR